MNSFKTTSLGNTKQNKTILLIIFIEFIKIVTIIFNTCLSQLSTGLKIIGE